MKLIGILCWFDERPAWLAGVAAALAKAEVAHLVAVDGAYGLYPGGRPSSDGEQRDAIIETCQALQIGCTLFAPRETFLGNEIEKRTMSLKLAEAVATPYEDWYLVVDADHFVTSAIGHLPRLAETDCDVANVRFSEPYGDLGTGCPLRCVFRAIPGLAYVGNHYTPRTPDGRNLHQPSEPALDLSCLEIEHRNGRRDARKQRQLRYYDRRDAAGAETHEHAAPVPA